MDHEPGSSLCDVLQQLDADAQDAFVSWLQEERNGSLKCARLTCSSLRRIIDCGVREARLWLRQTDLKSWEAGSRPPLRRWPRLRKLTVVLGHKVPPEQSGSLLALPFTQLPLEARQQITSITLGESCRTIYSSTAVTSVLLRLPCLEHVAICASMPDSLLEQQLLCDALASLPHVTELGLPRASALGAVSMLGSHLRRLELYGPPAPLNVRLTAAIGRLQQLQYLTVHAVETDEMCLLLGSLPPNLRELKLPRMEGLRHADTEMRVEGGHIASIAISDDVGLHCLCPFIGDGLLPSGGLAQRLERLSLETVFISKDAGGLALQPLSELLQRCACVKVEEVHIEDDAPANAAEECLALLGDGVGALNSQLPQKVVRGPGGHNRLAHSSEHCLRVRLQPQRPTTLMAGSNQADAAASPDEPSLVDLALEVLFDSSGAATGLNTAAGVAAAAGAASSRPTSDSGSELESDSESDQPSCLPLLLLRPPFQPGSPSPSAEESDDAEAWTRHWARHAAAAARLSRGSSWALEEGARFLPLPHPTTAAPLAVLVQLGTPAELAAAAAAAKLVADAAGVAACTGGEAAAAATAPAQVASVVVPLGSQHTWSNGAADALVCAMEQVAQSVADGEGLGAVWSPQRRLRWLLEQCKRMRELRVVDALTFRGTGP